MRRLWAVVNRKRKGAAANRKGATERRKPVVLKTHWKWRLLFVFAVIGGVICAIYATWASFYDLKALTAMPQRTLVYDYKGQPFGRLAGQDRVTVPIEKVSPHFVNALLAREDTRFYSHVGIDPYGIARAVVRNAISGRAMQGASTLTQQLARNSFTLGGKNLHRKLLEAFVSLRIEWNFSKREILESYVNRIYFGSGYWGVETASQAYFGKPSAQLTLSEAGILAGLIRSPQRFSPFRNPEGSLIQRDTVLGRMAELGMISQQEAEAAKQEPLRLNEERRLTAEQNYATDLIEQELSMLLDDDQIAAGGLRVFTTIDPVLQKAAQESLDRHLTAIEGRKGFRHPRRAAFKPADQSGTPYLQGAVVVIDHRTGGLRAIVGGRDFGESRFNRALLSSRQVGSTFKPFVYAEAYARGVVNPGSPVSDGPIRRREIAKAPTWRPGNSDGTFRGTLPAEEGLILSRNTMSARVGNLAGLGNVRKMGAAMGLGELPDFPSIYLGAFESSLKNMTLAYAALAAEGVKHPMRVIDVVQNPEGKVIYRSKKGGQRVFPRRIARMVTDGLAKAMARGTGSGSAYKGWAAGKTGTTNDFRDAWFIGYHRTLTCGVWVGLDQPAQIMPKGYGATLALPVWGEVMKASLGETADAGPPASKKAKEKKSDAPLGRRVLRSFRDFFERGQ